MSDESRRSDELVSAYLDGEATPAEIAVVEGDDALLARVEQMRAVRDALAAPVPRMSAERRDQTINAALAVADAEAAQRREAKIVPLHRPRQTLLAVAAAAVVLAAVVGAGLIASRGDSDSAETAADAPMAPDDAGDMSASAAEAAPAEADMATLDDSAEYEMAAEPMPEEEPMAEEAITDEAMAEEAMAEEAMAEEAAAEPESQMEAPAEDAADMPADTTGVGDTDVAEAERRSTEEEYAASTSTAAAATTDAPEPDSGGRALRVVDLGKLDDRESLFDAVGARLSAAFDDDAMTDPGACSAAVHEHLLELSAEALLSFIATVGAEDPVVIDVQLARVADGPPLIAYAATPGCEIEVHELDGS